MIERVVYSGAGDSTAVMVVRDPDPAPLPKVLPHTVDDPTPFHPTIAAVQRMFLHRGGW